MLEVLHLVMQKLDNKMVTSCHLLLVRIKCRTYFVFTTSLKIHYFSLDRYGTLCIRENPGCLFIATNRDAVGHMTDLQEWPGSFPSCPLEKKDVHI